MAIETEKKSFPTSQVGEEVQAERSIHPKRGSHCLCMISKKFLNENKHSLLEPYYN